MNNSRVVFEGFDAFRQALQALPDTLREEAADIVQQAAQETGDQLASHYPRKTGTLASRVRVTIERSAGSVRGKVLSQAPHAGIFEKGTKLRRTRQGWNRGAMPKAPEDQALIPRAIRARRRMVEQLKAMLVREGFLVEG